MTAVELCKLLTLQHLCPTRLIAVEHQGMLRAEVMVAWDDKGLDACVAKTVQLTDHMLVAQQFAVLRQIACYQQHVWHFREHGLDHHVEHLLTIVKQFPVVGQFVLPGRTVADDKPWSHHVGIRQYDDICLCPGGCCYQQGQNRHTYSTLLHEFLFYDF